jgi:hypothetical protein
MNPEFVQNLRYKLQKRVRRLNSLDFQVFHCGLLQFFGFLKSQSALQGILDDLLLRVPAANVEANRIFDSHEPRLNIDETENAATAYALLQKCAGSGRPGCEFEIGHEYDCAASMHNDALNVFRGMFLEPVYEYLDEQLDDQRLMLALLRRYKHKCEWFVREQLHRQWAAETQRGERALARHLYEYLHDQGIDFHIEPQSISGEVDLIAAQKTDDPVVLDAKIFDPSKGKSKAYIAKGFQQIYRYTVDFNEPFGYLVIYQTSEDDLRFSLPVQTQSTPFLIHNNKTIFLMAIDIFPHAKSASQRGPLKPTDITEMDLVQATNESGT